MSACETVAWAACSCGGRVAVKKNRSGLAYFRCDHCGLQVQHHWRRTSDKFLQGIGAEAEEKPAAPQPAPAVVAPEKAVKSKAPAGSVASMFGL